MNLPGDLFFEGVFFPFLVSLRVGVLLLETTLLLQLWFEDIDNFCMDWLQLRLALEMFLNDALSPGLMFSLLPFFAHRCSGPRVIGPSIVAKLFISFK